MDTPDLSIKSPKDVAEAANRLVAEGDTLDDTVSVDLETLIMALDTAYGDGTPEQTEFRDHFDIEALG